MEPNYFNNQFFFLSLLFLLFAKTVNSQCAGTNGSVVVCDKHSDVANRSFELFPHLNGTPNVGGTWSTLNPEAFFLLDTNTGEIDLWQVTTSGIYEFTYSNCGEQATVTLTLGGYAGEDNIDGSANFCGDAVVNLHQFLGSVEDGELQDLNGTWSEVPIDGGGLSGNQFDPSDRGPGEYTFVYTVPAIGPCSQSTATVILEIHEPAADAGEPSDLVVCSNDDLSAYTNIDLFDMLEDEDLGGTWSDNMNTGELSNLTDTVIDVEAINNNLGPGTYTFTYSIATSQLVCNVARSTVDIEILPAPDVIDLQLAVDDLCEAENIDINIDAPILLDGNYSISYQVVSESTGQAEISEAFTLNGGISNFLVDLHTLDGGNYTVTLRCVQNDSDPCRKEFEFELSETFAIDGIPGVPEAPEEQTFCLSDFGGAPPTLQNLDVSGNGNLLFYHTDTDIDILAVDTPINHGEDYFVSAIDPLNGCEESDRARILVTFLDTPELPNSTNTSPIFCAYNNATIADLEVTPNNDDIVIWYDSAAGGNILDSTTPLIDGVEYFAVSQNNQGCLGLERLRFVPSVISIPMVSLISSEVTLCGAHSLTVADLDGYVESSGFATSWFTEPEGGTQLPGDTPLTDQTTYYAEHVAPGSGCTSQVARTAILTNSVTEVPEAVEEQLFCLPDFGTTPPTLADLEVTASGDLLFYQTESDSAILALDTPLVDGEDYFVSFIDPISDCEGIDRTRIVVTLFSSPGLPTSTNTNPIFCDYNNPTIADIEIAAGDGNTIVWFDSATGGDVLETSTTLIDGVQYFAVLQNSQGCLAAERLRFTPTVISIPAVVLDRSSVALCGIDNLTIGDLDIYIEDSGFTTNWFAQAEGGTALAVDTPLTDQTTYYAEHTVPGSGCTAQVARAAIDVVLSNCDPATYDFYVPSGFSPNGDGINDTFFIPNIEIIFPDFSFEIFNRYGRLLFSGNAANPAWDGARGGGELPNGVYFYVIHFNKDSFEPEQGSLYLNR